MTEYLFQLLRLKMRRDSEHAISIETAVCAQHMEMRIISQEIAETLQHRLQIWFPGRIPSMIPIRTDLGGKEASDHSLIVKKVLGYLKEMNIPQDNIQTSRMNFGENWVYRNNSRIKEGYKANTFISFTVEDLNIYNELWMGLSKISGISVESISYDSSKRIETQNSTRKKALLNAKEKAEALADTISAKLGETLIIEEDLSTEIGYLNIMTQSRSTQRGDESNNTLALGKIPITQRVNVVFRLISKNSSN